MKIKTRVICFLLSFLLALSVLAGTARPAMAAGDGEYQLWIGGVQVTGENANDVFGDGKVRFTPAAAGGGALLELNGYRYTGEGAVLEGSNGWISAALLYRESAPLEVRFTGENALIQTGDPSVRLASGIYTSAVRTDLTLTGTDGEASLKTSAGSATTYSGGIQSNGAVRIENLRLDAAGGEAGKESDGIYALTGIRISGCGILASAGVCPTAGSGSAVAIVSSNVTIEDSNVTVIGGSAYNSEGVMATGELQLSGCKVVAESDTAYENALLSYPLTASGAVSIRNCTVQAKAAGADYNIAINSDQNRISIIDSTVTAESGPAPLLSVGVSAPETVTVRGTSDLTATGADTPVTGRGETYSCGVDGAEGIFIRGEGTRVYAVGGTGDTGYGLCSDTAVEIGEKVASVEAASPNRAVYGVVRNAIPGTGRTDPAGGGEGFAVPVSLEGAELPDYGRVRFAPRAPAENPFADVEEDAYYYDAVLWAFNAEPQVTAGTSETAFSPGAVCTRAQAVTFLWRASGEPEPVSAGNPFEDVPEDTYYSKAVLWAYETGVTAGTSETAFSPDLECTRAQVVTFLWRVVKEPAAAVANPFADVEENTWYTAAVLWAFESGTTAGTSDTTFSPALICTRDQTVTLLYRFFSGREPAFTEKTVPVLRGSLESAETAALRVYADLPDVPYMNVADFYNQFYLAGTKRTAGMDVVRTGNTYVATNFGGYSATFDTAAETVAVDDLKSFASPGYYLEIGPDDADDNYPFLEVTSVHEPEEPVPLLLCAGDYGIDLRGDETGVYLPLATLCDLFSTTALYRVVFSGVKIYVQDFGETLQKGSALAEDPDYPADVSAARSEALADFTYGELCFFLDLWYGKPGQEWAHEDLQTMRVDELLGSKYPKIREMLSAPDFETFFKGLAYVFYGILFDGGHTMLTSRLLYEDAVLATNALQPLYQEDFAAGILDFFFVEGEERTQREAVRNELYQGGFYAEQGDTAMIAFDQFVVNHDAWKAFYAGTGERPLEGDSMGTVLAGLERAAANPAIKNVVFDVSCNGGGDSWALLAVEWLMSGEGEVRFRDDLAGQIATYGVNIDMNFDGAFDERDVSPFTQFNYGVLTSRSSFSCTNAFAWFAREHGITLLGEQSGGGACAINLFSVGGVECSVSAASNCIVNAAGESVDNGCPVDVYLRTDGENPYEDFYSLSLISACMNHETGSYRFADREEAAAILLGERDYLDHFTQNDLNYRMQKTGATRDEFEAFIAEQTLDFTDEEKAAIDDAMTWFVHRCKARGYQFPVPEGVVFAKTTMREECGAGGYTHGTNVFFGELMMKYATSAVASERKYFRAILTHEIFHCLTRSDPAFRRDMYGLLGFTIADTDFTFSDEIREAIIANPDVEHHDAYAAFEINGEMRNCVVVFTNRPFAEPGDSFFTDMQTGLVPIDETDVMFSPDDAANFWDVFGRNTGYVIDPEETLADNFAYTVVDGTDQDYQTPELILAIDAYLKNFGSAA